MIIEVQSSVRSLGCLKPTATLAGEIVRSTSSLNQNSFPVIQYASPQNMAQLQVDAFQSVSPMPRSHSFPPIFINGSDSTTDPDCDLLVSMWKPEGVQPITTKWTPYAVSMNGTVAHALG